jgi:phage repressor protein C with HTH and peptisase S24 domain
VQHIVEQLQQGQTVKFRPKGNSMSPKINSGQLVEVSPLKDTIIKEGDIVLCKVKGRLYLHLVKGVGVGEFLIGNNKGHINGWTRQIYGIVTGIWN